MICSFCRRIETIKDVQMHIMAHRLTISHRLADISLEVPKSEALRKSSGTPDSNPILSDVVAQMRKSRGSSKVLVVGSIVVTCTGRGGS